MTKSNNIYVTKSFLPPLEEYIKYLKIIWRDERLTNQGELLQCFESKMKKFLNIENFQFVTNGTIALQIALKSLDITDGEIITTPFTYVATTSAIIWERCKPVYCDINPDTLCIDVHKIEALINKNTKAIMPVHVFGNPCDIDKIDEIAKKYNLKVIYDAAHGFGVEYKGKSLLDYGDISICSFHSTKLMHTIEGGTLVAKDKVVDDKISLIKKFGHFGDNHYMLGFNGKASEFQAAMGLVNIEYINKIIKQRKLLTAVYNRSLDESIRTQSISKFANKINYSYYPVIFKNENEVLLVLETLNDLNIYPRRYFYPSLNELTYLKESFKCPISEDISKRILCLPLYDSLSVKTVIYICDVINNVIRGV